MRALHLQPLADWIQGAYQTAAAEADIHLTWAGDATEDDVLRLASETDVVITGQRRVGAALLEAAPGLRLVQVQGRAPWAVDMDAAARAGIPVSMLPHRGAIAVAEHAMALMLGLCRLLVEGHQGTVAGRYRERDVEPIRTDERTINFNWLKFDRLQELHGRTLGLVGMGDIALEVARRARAFDMTVLYSKRTPLPRGFDALAGVRAVPFDELLARADVLSLHAPHTPETTGLIGAEQLARMKESALLVNTSRGGLVDEGALAAALRSGRLGGAGLDVFLYEPLPADHPFTDCPNLLLSPHVGGGAGGGQRGMIRDVVANLVRVRDGEAPSGLIQP